MNWNNGYTITEKFKQIIKLQGEIKINSQQDK